MLDQQIEELMRRSSNISKIVDIDSGEDFTVRDISQSAERPKATDLSRNSAMSDFRKRLMARLESRSSTQRSFDQILLPKYDDSESDDESEQEFVEFDRTAVIEPRNFDAAGSPSLKRLHTKLSDLKLSSFKKPDRQPLINGFGRVYTYEDDEHSTQEILTELKFKNTTESKSLFASEQAKAEESSIGNLDVMGSAPAVNPVYIYAVVVVVIAMMIVAELMSIFSTDI